MIHTERIFPHFFLSRGKGFIQNSAGVFRRRLSDARMKTQISDGFITACYTSAMAMPRPCPTPCNVLLIGGGGREHALAWKLSQSPRLGDLWLSDGASAPANAGLATLGKPCPVPMDARDAFRMQRWCDT